MAELFVEQVAHLPLCELLARHLEGHLHAAPLAPPAAPPRGAPRDHRPARRGKPEAPVGGALQRSEVEEQRRRLAHRAVEVDERREREEHGEVREELQVHVRLARADAPPPLGVECRDEAVADGDERAVRRSRRDAQCLEAHDRIGVRLARRREDRPEREEVRTLGARAGLRDLFTATGLRFDLSRDAVQQLMDVVRDELART